MEETAATPPLFTVKLLPTAAFNRIFTPIYLLAVLALLYHHAQSIFHSSNFFTCFTIILMFIADFILAFMWCTSQASRLYPVRRREFPENLEKVVERSDFPAIDVFICTADPTKEPPMSVVNTALSVMAYDYPPEKLSVYVSDDGGSEVTLFAFMEAAKFASQWLPFCRDNNVVERNPETYFESIYASSSISDEIKMMYESMKTRVEHVTEREHVDEECITNDKAREIFKQWTPDFTRQNHPTVIQVLLENNKDKDIGGYFLPNLIYLSREKRKSYHHHFKAGALNVLLRISAIMTNAPILLTLDCDMYSNDPNTPKRVLCYYGNTKIRNEYAYIQFPQHFKGVNKDDIYGGEFKRLFQINPIGFDGLGGPNFVGTNCFFSRRALFGGPSSFVKPELVELSPNHAPNKLLKSQEVVTLASQVAQCNYENGTTWGYKLGFRYGSLVEDLFTGYRLQGEGWKSMFCNPDRSAFLGDAPSNLLDLLNQQKRWAIGVLEIGFSKYSSITYGVKHLGFLLGLIYSQNNFWPSWSIPIIIYAFLPQLALLNNVSIFPKVSEPTWFLLYLFLFLGAYAQDVYDFVSAKGTFKMWWNDQRIWIIRGLTCLPFGALEFFLKALGIPTQGFNVTSKLVDNERSKRYHQGLFEFGISSPMFVLLSTASLVNLVAFIWGITQLVMGEKDVKGLETQMLIAGFGVVNSWPIYEAMVLRKDKGKMPSKVTIFATLITFGIIVAFSFILFLLN
ncbi:cellulose synthase like G3 [Euphorbia peplus]|nr:cellulose synthase like G3 [Euphorbia peplus]